MSAQVGQADPRARLSTLARLVRMAFANAADGSMATTSICSRHAAGAGGEPRTDPGVAAAIDDAEDPAGVQINDRGHPRLVPAPPPGGQPEVADPTEAMLIDPDAAHPPSCRRR